jgi:hypothetical protein
MLDVINSEINSCLLVHLNTCFLLKNQMLRLLVQVYVISGPKKVSIFRAHPFRWPSKCIFPHQNPYVPLHINNKHRNSLSKHMLASFMYLRL